MLTCLKVQAMLLPFFDSTRAEDIVGFSFLSLTDGTLGAANLLSVSLSTSNRSSTLWAMPAGICNTLLVGALPFCLPAQAPIGREPMPVQALSGRETVSGWPSF